MFDFSEDIREMMSDIGETVTLLQANGGDVAYFVPCITGERETTRGNSQAYYSEDSETSFVFDSRVLPFELTTGVTIECDDGARYIVTAVTSVTGDPMKTAKAVRKGRE